MQITSTPSTFRDDINGLRAWAVVAVVLYHFGVPGFAGGFVGVDVFFVISGFLMTGIVVRGLEREGKNYSILSFYMSRARRILPALIVLCAVLLVAGWWVLLPPDYKMLGGHAVASLSFLSNIQFWREAGYFDAASHEKLLLHTWSLAVEWQFYLLLPIAFWTIWRLAPKRRSLLIATWIGLAASLVLSIAISNSQPSAAFFLLPTRAWEMLAGGLIFFAHGKPLAGRSQRVMEGAGFLLIASSILIFDELSSWPGWRALLPVIGTAAVLAAARSQSAFTGTVFAQWIGTRSYSIYLWHWPIAVALTHLTLDGNPWAIAVGLAVTIVLGALSYQCVESTSRVSLERLRLHWGALALIVATFVVAAPSLEVRLKDGVWSRFPPEIVALSRGATDINPRMAECHRSSGTTSPACMVGGRQLSAVLLGDSHATSVVTAIAGALSTPNSGVMELSYSSCPTLFGTHSTPGRKSAAGHDCNGFLRWAQAKLRTTSKDVPLIIVNRSNVYVSGYNERSATFRSPLIYFSEPVEMPTAKSIAEFIQNTVSTTCELAKDRQVYLVRPTPELLVNVPTTQSRAMLRGEKLDISVSLDDYHKRNASVWAAQDAAKEKCGVKILDPLPYLCEAGRCSGTRGGRAMYWDDNHLSGFGASLLIPMFAEVFDGQARSPTAAEPSN